MVFGRYSVWGGNYEEVLGLRKNGRHSSPNELVDYISYVGGGFGIREADEN